jgi:hypothetical protein
VNRTIRVLDTGALLGYSRQTDSHVPYQLAFCADENLTMQTSSLCVAEAYRDCEPDAVDLLDIMLALPTVEIADFRTEDADMVGNIAERVERLSLAHSCLLVWQNDVPLMTTDAGRAGKVLETDLVWDLA